MAQDEILRLCAAGVTRARELCADVEFSPEDASRTELEFLAQVIEVAIATSITWARNSSSVREASSGENSTSAHSSRARVTPAAHRRRISSCAMLSLY